MRQPWPSAEPWETAAALWEQGRAQGSQQCVTENSALAGLQAVPEAAQCSGNPRACAWWVLKSETQFTSQTERCATPELSTQHYPGGTMTSLAKGLFSPKFKLTKHKLLKSFELLKNLFFLHPESSTVQ